MTIKEAVSITKKVIRDKEFNENIVDWKYCFDYGDYYVFDSDFVDDEVLFYVDKKKKEGHFDWDITNTIVRNQQLKNKMKTYKIIDGNFDNPVLIRIGTFENPVWEPEWLKRKIEEAGTRK